MPTPSSQAATEFIPLASTSNMAPEDYSLPCKSTADEQLQTFDCDEESGSSRVLRPRKLDTLQDVEIQTWSGMRLVHGDMMLQACNEAFAEHAAVSVDCNQPQFAVKNEKKVGVCWKISLQCSNCNFTTLEKNCTKRLPLQGLVQSQQLQTLDLQLDCKTHRWETLAVAHYWLQWMFHHQREAACRGRQTVLEK